MSEKSGWINFNELRAKLKALDVLEHYKVKLAVKGTRATGFCPLSTHQGQRKSPSFSVDLDRGIWQCFGCRAKGGILDLAARLAGFDPNDPKQLRQAALKIVEVFQISQSDPPANPPVNSPPSAPKQTGKSALINPPIDFELQTLDVEHPYLKDRGFTDETTRYFGLGFCNRGMLKGRIAIPLHNPQGQLVGYGGRITKDELINERCPKYLFPGSRERNGQVIEFRKSLLLYNAHRITKPVDHVFVVEGFPSTWWLWQAKYRNVVALMGSSYSQEQGRLIVDLVKPDGKVWIIPDGNDAGRHCATSVFEHVAPHRLCRWIPLGKDEQPTDYAVDDLLAVMVSGI